jgi:hypothetical protein
MPLITGQNSPRFSQYTSDLLTGTGSQTIFSLSRTPPTAASLVVTIDGVKQHSSTYTLGTNQIIFSEAPPSGSSIECVAIGTQGATLVVTDSSITTPKIVYKNVTSDKLEDNIQITSLGIGTAASGTTGEIRAANAITSYYSDERLKENIAKIENALAKVRQLDGVTYNANELAETYGFFDKSKQVGVLAGTVEKVQPEAVKPAPFDIIKDENGNDISKSGLYFKTVQYERLIPLLIEAIKELDAEVQRLKAE